MFMGYVGDIGQTCNEHSLSKLGMLMIYIQLISHGGVLVWKCGIKQGQ
jgi:hypothetical protein